MDGKADLDPKFINQVIESSNVRILSIRECWPGVVGIPEPLSIGALHKATADKTLKLQGLYMFGSKDVVLPSRFRKHLNGESQDNALIGNSARGNLHSHGAQLGADRDQWSEASLAYELELGDQWYDGIGKLIHRQPTRNMTDILRLYGGQIDFDAVLCRGPRHQTPDTDGETSGPTPWYKHDSAYIHPKVATCTVGGCQSCGAAPEGFSMFGQSPDAHLPLLAPPPLHSSTIRAAKTPSNVGSERKFIARCADCLRNRYCEDCHKWVSEIAIALTLADPHNHGLFQNLLS